MMGQLEVKEVEDGFVALGMKAIMISSCEGLPEKIWRCNMRQTKRNSPPLDINLSTPSLGFALLKLFQIFSQ